MQITDKLNFDKVLGKESRIFYMGIAMLWVIGYHLWLHDIDYYDNQFKLFSHIFKFGYVGVDVFFFLSAYGLCHSYSQNDLKTFYFRRFVRIFPLFIVYYSFRFIIGVGEDFPTYLWHGILQITSLSVIQTPFTCPTKALSLDWFVPAILNLYIIFPMLFKVIKYISSKGTIWHILFLITLFYGAHFLWGYINGLYISRIPIIVIGIFTYFYLKHANYDKIFLLYAVFALQVFFIERHNLMYSAPIPLILYGVNMSNFNINNTVPFRIVKVVGNWSLEFFYAHIYAISICTCDNLFVFYILFSVVTIGFAIASHLINTKTSKLLLSHS